ncbi:MAG: HAD family phosphatase [Halioglobus sp.]|nr:HAD family phosphatase [Halioglobus sp.]
MELVVFDLDGTLLNANAEVSNYTAATLRQLHRRGIAYTVATGRTLHGARDLLAGHGFQLPQIYKNGVMIWQPEADRYSAETVLTVVEIRVVLDAFRSVDVTPFIFTLEPDNEHVVYHAPPKHPAEQRLQKLFADDRAMILRSLVDMPQVAAITNISALGSAEAIGAVVNLIRGEDHLVAYAGYALEGEGLHWVDIHHSAASKGDAVAQLKKDLGMSQVICFGDSDNDLSMFAVADECYAPANAKQVVLDAATAVIGHHDEDGIAQCLRKRFDLK